MQNKEFIKYIGNHKVQDGIIKEIIEDDDIVKVIIESCEEEELYIEFKDVYEIKSKNPEGMMLYGIAEVKNKEPFREFHFLNWNEERPEFLHIVAKEYEFYDNNN